MLYSTPTLPNHWIAIGDDGGLYLAPNIAGGWQQRRRYSGQLAGLTATPATDAMLRYLKGHPWDQMLSGAIAVEPPPLLSLAAAALIAGVNPASLRHAIRDQRLTGVERVSGWHVERAVIERYIAQRRPNYRRTGDVRQD